jgi:integrase
LQVSLGSKGNLNRSWLFIYNLPGRPRREMGLGSCDDVSLEAARAKRIEYRALVKQGLDPIAARDAEKAKNLAASAAAVNFDSCWQAYVSAHRGGWTNSKHAAQWPTTLKVYASPVLGKMDVSGIETAHVMQVLTKDDLWQQKPETASRLRGRIESVLGWATVSGFRCGDNPARWKGHLSNLLPARSKIAPVVHQPALPYAEMPVFMAELRQREGIAALALEFAILTCVRSSDVRNAKSEDIDAPARLWVIPALSKTGQRHIVPLSDAALAAFTKARGIAAEGDLAHRALAFPSSSGGALSASAMLEVLERMGRAGTATTHGFRATFRTWAQEQTSFAFEVSEMALGHKVGDAVTRAYARGDALKKRIAIMQAWANFVGKPPGVVKVVAFSNRGAP